MIEIENINSKTKFIIQRYDYFIRISNYLQEMNEGAPLLTSFNIYSTILLKTMYICKIISIINDTPLERELLSILENNLLVNDNNNMFEVNKEFFLLYKLLFIIPFNSWVFLLEKMSNCFLDNILDFFIVDDNNDNYNEIILNNHFEEVIYMLETFIEYKLHSIKKLNNDVMFIDIDIYNMDSLNSNYIKSLILHGNKIFKTMKYLNIKIFIGNGERYIDLLNDENITSCIESDNGYIEEKHFFCNLDIMIEVNILKDFSINHVINKLSVDGFNLIYNLINTRLTLLNYIENSIIDYRNLTEDIIFFRNIIGIYLFTTEIKIKNVITCAVCFNDKSDNRILIRCGHSETCNDCLLILNNTTKKCPICRSKF